MKRKVAIGAVYVGSAIGFRPDAVTVYNPTDKRVYMREGAIDNSVGPASYDYVIQPGGSITVPTEAANFSFIQEAGASRDALALFWTKDEIAPSLFGAESAETTAQEFTAYDFATLAPDAVTPVSAGVPAGSFPLRMVLGPVESNAIRYRYDGGNPTTAAGALLNVGDTLILEGNGNIVAFRAIATAGTSSIPRTLED